MYCIRERQNAYAVRLYQIEVAPVRQRKLEPQLKKLREKQEKLEEKQQLLQRLEEVPEAARSKAQIKRLKNLKKVIQDLQDDLAKPRPKLDCLQTSPLFDRPDPPLYEGVSNIFVGVLLDLDKHLVVTIVAAIPNSTLYGRFSVSY